MPFEIQREVVSFVIASLDLFLTFPYPFHALVVLLPSSLNTAISHLYPSDGTVLGTELSASCV